VAIERISSARDERVGEYRDLTDPELRRRRGLFVVEGRESVRVLLATARFRVRSALVSPATLAPLGEAFPGEVPVYVADGPVLAEIAGVRFHQGCVALAERPGATPAQSLLAEPGPRLLLLLEDVTDPDNVGGAFRNAFAFGVDAALLSARCADPLYRKAIRTSIGATLRIPFARVEDWPALLERARGAGFRIVALVPGGRGVDVARLADLPERVALIAGNEGEGLAPSTLEAADLAVRIPMAAGADSLNVAVACGIALHRIRSGGSGGRGLAE
jgi:tRNA G18 (ribose-2'-O)-methylase SpoU